MLNGSAPEVNNRAYTNIEISNVIYFITYKSLIMA